MFHEKQFWKNLQNIPWIFLQSVLVFIICKKSKCMKMETVLFRQLKKNMKPTWSIKVGGLGCYSRSISIIITIWGMSIWYFSSCVKISNTWSVYWLIDVSIPTIESRATSHHGQSDKHWKQPQWSSSLAHPWHLIQAESCLFESRCCRDYPQRQMNKRSIYEAPAINPPWRSISSLWPAQFLRSLNK